MTEPETVETREGQTTARVVANVVRMRKQRGWTAADLVARMEAAAPDVKFTRSTLANLEAGRRSFVTLTELAVVAKALDADPWSLTGDAPAICLACGNHPPVGYQCLTCKAANEGPAT